MKILNLYAGIGGNRKFWDGEITAVEIDPKIAEIYQQYFPNDKVVVDDAHQFLLDHHKEYDFIWSSPPCPTHSVTSHYLYAQGIIRYPDMNLYQEIIFLDKLYKGKYCVENVISYYDPLVKPQVLDRHYFWTNFYITPFNVYRPFNVTNTRASTRKDKDTYLKLLQDFHGFHDVTNVELLRNCVYPPLGKHILDCAKGTIQQKLVVEAEQ